MVRFRLGALAAGICAGAALAQEPPVYRLSYIPDEQTNVICFARADALDFLTAFRAAYIAEARPRDKVILRGFSDQMGPDKRFDCSFLKSIYVPILPIDIIDLDIERDIDWEDKKEHYFVASNILVGETKYTKTATGESIYVLTNDFVILEE